MIKKQKLLRQFQLGSERGVEERPLDLHPLFTNS